jgi:hypothetical protein
MKARLLALIAVVLTLTSCRHPAKSQNTIVLDDSLVSNRGIAIDFASAFALEQSCSGLKLMRFSSPGFDYPSTPYWALDVFNSPGGPSDVDPPVRWTIAHGGGKVEGYATGSGAKVSITTGTIETKIPWRFIHDP